MHRKPSRQSCGGPLPAPHSSGTDSPPTFEQVGELDLQELLQVCGFNHWHGLLQDLFQRYAGWLSHYWMEERFELDFWPAADVISALMGLPIKSYGDDHAFCRALVRCDFVFRQARDSQSGASWNALREGYREFQLAHVAEPYWGDAAPWSEDEFAQWALAQVRGQSS